MRVGIIKGTKVSTTAIAVCLAMIFAVPGRAQQSTGPTWQDSVSQHHQLQYQIMKDMTDQLAQMTEAMARGELTPEQSRQMARQMKLLSTMMRRMLGLAGRPPMRESERRKQMVEMRKLMDQMIRDSRMAPGAR